MPGREESGPRVRDNKPLRNTVCISRRITWRVLVKTILRRSTTCPYQKNREYAEK
jgi:hypothetical protein